MISLYNIFRNNVLNEAVNRNEIESAIKNRRRVALNYEGDPEHGIAPGMRYADIYSMIETRAGNIALRAYQPFGDTASKVPAWKIFRVDRITDWHETPQVFKEPAPGFNPTGDRGANRVIMMANFGSKTPQVSQPQVSNVPTNGTQQQTTQSTDVDTSKVYKTDTERNMERLKQQVDNPTYIDQYKQQNNIGQPQEVEPQQNNIPQVPQQNNVDMDNSDIEDDEELNNNNNKLN